MLGVASVGWKEEETASLSSVYLTNGSVTVPRVQMVGFQCDVLRLSHGGCRAEDVI
jgi:hypothetical protein